MMKAIEVVAQFIATAFMIYGLFPAIESQYFLSTLAFGVALVLLVLSIIARDVGDAEGAGRGAAQGTGQ